MFPKLYNNIYFKKTVNDNKIVKIYRIEQNYQNVSLQLTDKKLNLEIYTLQFSFVGETLKMIHIKGG